MKNEKGQITIMMIITVIVLIIIGGICIFMLTGENGLFIPKRDEEKTQQNETNTNNIENSDSTQNANNIENTNNTQNENGALTVPMQ